MKINSSYLLLIMMILSHSQCMSQSKDRDIALSFLQIPKKSLPDSIKETLKSKNQFFWGEINLGYSNVGAGGSLSFNYKKGNRIFSFHYAKYHNCFDSEHEHDEDKDNKIHSEKHISFESVALLTGIMLPWKWNPGLSFGISWNHYSYINTIPIEHNFTLSRIWETAINSDYNGEKLHTDIINTIGIPLLMKFHFSPKRAIGMDAGIRADLNMHHTIIAIELGIRFGKIKSIY